MEAGADPNRPNPTNAIPPLLILVSGWDSRSQDSEPGSPRRKALRHLLASGADPDCKHKESVGGDVELDVRDFLPKSPAAHAAFEADCAWARAHRLSQRLVCARVESTQKPRF